MRNKLAYISLHCMAFDIWRALPSRRSDGRIYQGGIFEHGSGYSIPYIICKHNLSITFIEVGGYT